MSRPSYRARLTQRAALALLTAALLPGGAHAQSQAAALEHPMEVRYDVQVRMPDGVQLSVDIFRPKSTGKHPALFALTPYNNDEDDTLGQAWQFVQRGYAYVVADARGRYDSGGEFYPYRTDGADGAAVMSWIAQQPWSNGRVATHGASYLGKNQWLMAREGSPHHAAIVSYVGGASDFHDGTRYNGVPKLDLRYTWMMGMDGRVNQSRTGWNWNRAMYGLPLSRLDAVVGRDIAAWRDLMQNAAFGDYWAATGMVPASYGRFDLPTFSVTGWYEGQLKGQVQNHVETVRTSKQPDAHMLVIGPWLHSVNRNRVIGERDAGPEAIINLDRIRDRWLDHVMLGTERPEYARFLYFLPVQNEWRAAAAFPIPNTEFRAYHLDSQGRANTLFGNGVLRAGQPGRGQPDAYTYDPRTPVLSQSSRTAGARGGLPQGSVDHRAVETREDVLVYTSEALAQGMEITGPVKASIYISTDVADTDITIKLLDVYPDGRAHNLSEGIARAKYRTSYSAPEPLQAGQVYKLEVELFPTSNYFQPGHRVRIEVSSSDFPNFARNLNTMNSDTGTDMRTAHTRIHHTAQYPSHITLPVIPAGASRPWKP